MDYYTSYLHDMYVNLEHTIKLIFGTLSIYPSVLFDCSRTTSIHMYWGWIEVHDKNWRLGRCPSVSSQFL